MFSSETGSRVAIPAIVLAAVTVLTRLIIGIQFASFYDIGVILIAVVIVEFFALLTCYPLVIARGKSQRYVWANYIIWMILLNLGPLAQHFAW